MALPLQPGSRVAAYGEMTSAPPPFSAARVPTLLVLGREDSYVTYDHLLDDHRAALGDLLEVVTVPGGHTLLWDAPAGNRRGDSRVSGAQPGTSERRSEQGDDAGASVRR